MIHTTERNSRPTDNRFIRELKGGLTITNAMLEDDGQWQCEAENAMGYVKNAKPLQIVVLGKCCVFLFCHRSNYNIYKKKKNRSSQATVLTDRLPAPGCRQHFRAGQRKFRIEFGLHQRGRQSETGLIVGGSAESGRR